jgi:fibronectin-binding autotransporter adhesin
LSLTGSGTSIGTFTTGSWFNTLDFGSTVFTLAATALNLNGLTLSTGAGVYTNLTPTMVGTGSINTNGKTLTTLTVNNTGTTTLASAVTTSTSTTLTSGTLALAGFTLTPTQFISGTAATRAISGAGTGVISLSNDWTVSDGTGFTGSDYTINMTKATAKTFAGAGGSYGTLVQAGAGALTISGSNTLADVQATTRPSTISFTAGTTQTVSLFTLAGTSGNLVTINSVTSGSQFTLSKASGTVTASYLSIKDSNATGGAVWNAYNGTNTNVSNNTGWLFTPPSGTGNGNFMAFF